MLARFLENPLVIFCLGMMCLAAYDWRRQQRPRGRS